jgi:hypothetical protein
MRTAIVRLYVREQCNICNNTKSTASQVAPLELGKRVTTPVQKYKINSLMLFDPVTHAGPDQLINFQL